jgi:hypothetical protein
VLHLPAEHSELATGFVEFLCDTAIYFAVTTAERAFTLFVFSFPSARWTFDLIAS